MERRFYLIDNGLMIKSNWRDMIDDARVSVIKKYKDVHPFFSLIRKIHITPKINRIISLPWKDIWCDSVKAIKWEDGKNIEYYIIFEETAIYPISLKYLKKIKQKYNVHYILFYQDPWQSYFSESARNYQQYIKFDYIFTLNPADAQKYGLIYFNTPYSMLSKNESIVTINDLYFVGVAKDRLNLILEVFECGRKSGIKMLFMIDRVTRSLQKDDDMIIYNKRIPYSEVVEKAKASNCILEILAGGHSGSTLRYCEAVCYNKKLLTNNKNVVNLPFYNPDYIHVFEKPEDIDWNWVEEKIPVDYHYDGQFSPTYLIDRIIELEEEKERQQNAEKETS